MQVFLAAAAPTRPASQQLTHHYLKVAQRVADGNVAVQGHDQEDVAVKDNEEVDAEHLE